MATGWQNTQAYLHLTCPQSSLLDAGIAGWGQNERSVAEGSARGDRKEENPLATLLL